jgi:iron complex transport system permease protein
MRIFIIEPAVSRGCYMPNSRTELAGRRPQQLRAVSLCLIAAVLAGLSAVMIGSRHLNLPAALRGISPDREILLQLRLPRALLALWTGGSLALAGVLFQALLRNSLATPYTLGVSGGASLGAVLAIVLGFSSSSTVSGVSMAACAGSAVVLALNVAAASGRGRMSSTSLLLAGVTINSMCGAAILFLSSIAGFMQSFAVTRWLMGSMDSPEYRTLLWLSLLLAPVCGIVFWFGRQWNLIAVGDTWAAVRGINLRRLLLIGCISGSILTGAVTALTGPIGFVGLIVPHALRLWVGADHRVLAPCSFFVGAAFLALCDVLSRTILAPVEIPVGAITALVGGPVFIWMLNGYKRSVSI